MRLIWATRGYHWGYRFLEDGGFEDPLPEYEKQFARLASNECFDRHDDIAVLRFTDPEGRCDQAGRLIEHDCVCLDIEKDDQRFATATNARSAIWEHIGQRYAQLWDGSAASE